MTSTATNGKSDKLLQQQNGASNPNGAAANGVTSTTTEVNASFLRAARAGNLDKVLEYLNQNIDINVSNSNGLNALHLASKEGHVHVVKELLERSANVNAATKKGNTALHIASLAGQFDVVELLVKFGANVDCRSQNGFTPLYMAAQENHIEVVKFLLANNANQSLATEDGFTPLAVALQQGHEKVVAILLENDSRGKIRLPALHIAAKKNDVKAAALLLNNDPNMDLSPEARMVNCTTKSGFTPLHIAAHYGNVEIAKFLVTKGADVNFEARQNITPLHVATKWGKVNSVNLLLDSGAKIDVKTRDGLTPLHCAARSGHDSVVELLIARQAPINAKTKNGLTALHMAAQGDHVEAARILLYHSPKLVDQTTCDFLTALHVAAHCGHVKIAKLLLDHKADVNARALNGFTPLHIACKKNRIKVIELLIKHGAFKEATTESGLTPLHVASFMGCMNVVVFLIQHGAQPNVPTIRGETPLHLATRANQTDIVRILLRHGAAVNAEAKEKQTPLHIATRLGNTDIIALLLRHGAAVDAATSDGYTALHIASKEGQEEVASILFESGASLNVTTKKGFTPLHIAAKYGNIKVASLLLQRKALPDVQGKNGLTPLHVATHYNRPSVAHLLLEHGASPHIVAKNGYSALHIAAKKNQMDIATTLLEYSAKTNCESNAGFTPLHLACQEGHLDMSSLLLDHAADASAASRNGLTPLHLCAQEDKVNCAAVLVKAGAPIDPQTKAGYTPLHVACHFGQINMVKFLLQHRADVNIITKHGFTSLHCAAQQGHVLIVKLLLEHGASPDITNNNGQTPLAIAQRLGYISVIEELKLVTQTTLVSTTIKTTEEKYKVQTPETMQETFMSDSEDELGDEGMFNAADYTTYLTDEAHLHNAADESIALTPKTPKREEAAKLESVQIGDQQSPTIQQTPPSHQTVAPPTTAATTTATTTSTSKTTPTYADQQQSILLHQQQLQQTPVSAASEKRAGRRTDGHTVGSVANMSMAESMDGSYYNGYDTTKHSAMIETDNIPLEARPKSAGLHLHSFTNLTTSYHKSQDFSMFSSRSSLSALSHLGSSRDFLISFMVDARGGAMKGCRHSGVRVIIPPKRASMPTRITCRFVRKEKLTVSPPLNESEALAARVLEMGPHGCKFLGPVVLEIPHYASLRNREREIVILRSDSGEKWYEHPIIATEQAIEEALGCTLELAAANAIQSAADAQADAQSAQHHHDDLQSAKLRITRIITNDFPKYFALISRVRHETHAVSEVGGVISSTIVPKAQAVFPEKALQKKIKISLQAMPIPTELVVKMFGNRVAVSPIVTIEPRRRKFHKAITLTIPLPKSPLKGMLNSYSHTNESFSLRLLCSITGGLAPAQWEDITGHTPLSYIDECVSFTTTVSARFWLMDCQAVSEATKMATELYREAIAVPYMARFIVYAKRHEFNESRLRVYCITDDKEEKVLETREQFVTVAKSKEVEVLGDRVQWLEMGGNITPVESNKQSGDQLNMLFAAFYENRLPFTVRIKDVDHSPATGRLVFLKDAKNAPLKSDLRSPPVCTLDIQLPGYDRDAIEHDEARRRQTLSRSGGAIQFTFLNGSGQLSQSGTNLTQPSLDFNLRLLANDLNNSDRLPPFDWTRLAQRLDVSPDEIEALKVSSAGASIFQQSPSNLTYDMLVHWQNKYNNMVADQLQAATDSGAPSTSVPAPAGEQLLSALRDLQVDEEIIQRNMSSSFVTSGGPQSASRTQQQSSSLSAENILSVEKSLAKLNVNLNELSKKDEPTTDSSLKARKSLLGANYEEKDMTKESESADDYSENEDSQQKVSTIQSSKIEENIVTTTIIGEERIHHEPTGLVSETIVDSVIEARNGDNFKQHFEDRTEVKYEEPDASRTAYYDNDDYDEKQQQLEQQNRTDLEEEEHLVEQEEEKKPDERSELVGQDESAVVEKPSQHEAYEDEQGSEYYDRDQELDVEVNYQIDMDSGPISSTTTTKIGEASSYRRPSDLKDLDLDFSTANEASNRAMETIEKQSPIIERELLTTEQQLENLRSRLAMSESVSAVTQSMLESIRREYNLPESKDTEEEEAVNYSSSNDEAPIDYYKEKEEEQGADESLVTSSSGNEAEVEVLKQETTQIISDVNRDMQEKLEQIEGKIREKQVHDVIEKFAKESQSQIEKIMMIQSLEEPDEVEEEPLVPVHSSGSGDESSKAQDEIISGARKLSLSQTRLIEEGASESDSNVENREEQPEMSRKLSLSQTQLIEDASESGEDIPIKPPLSPKSPKTLNIQETSSTLTPAVRKLSISQTRLIEEEEEEEVSESDVIEHHEHKIEDIQPVENIIEDNTSEKPYDQFNMLSKSRQYQTFESSSSTNSELNKQEDFKQRHKRDDDDDNDDDEFGGGGGSRIAASLATSKIEETEEKTQLIEDTEEVKIEEPLPAATISYSSGEVSSESIGETAAAATEPTRFLAVASSGIKESESHEFLLEDAKQEEDEELEASVSLERFDVSSTSSKNHLEPASSRTLDGSNEDVSVTTVIERRSSDQEKETKKKKKTQKESSTEISSEAYETDEENHPHVPTTTIEAVTLLSSSDQEEEAEKEAGNRSGGSSENLEVTVDLITEEPLIQVEKQQQPEAARSSLYLDLDTTSVNKSESREPLIGAAAEPPVIEELTLEEEVPGRDDYPNDSPPVMYENSSCGASMTSCSTMSEENLIKSNTSAQAESDSNIDQQFSKSLTYLESLVVPSSTGDLLIENKSGGSELFFEEKDDKEPDDFGGSSGEDLYPDKNIKRNSQSLTFTKSGAVQRPMSFTVRPSQEIDDNDQMLKSSELLQLEQLQQEQQTPTPVENIAGDFFDKRITSSNEPSIDRLTSTSDAGGNVALRDSIGREISNESLESYAGIKSENEELEAKAAFATAFLFSSTIKSQSSDEVKSVTSAHQTSKHTDEEGDVPIEEEAQTFIQDATPRSFTKYITLKKDSNEDIFSEQSKDDEFVKDSEEESKLEQQGIDNPCFDATTDQSHDEEEKSSSTESVIINHDYDDSEDQQRMKIKIIQSSLPSKSIPQAAATTSQELIEEEEEGEEFEPPVTSDIEEQVDIDERELKTGISLLTERIEPSDSDFMINQPETSKPLEEEIIRTKDGVVLDDQAFLVCTPTPSNLTPQIEKDIGVELSHLDEQTEELAAKLIVETAIEKSVEKVIREQEEREEELAKEEEIIQRSRKSSIITDEHELELLKEEYEIVEEIKPNESAEARELIEAFEESLREQDYVVLGQSEVVLEPSEPPLLVESPLVEVKSPIKRDEETLFSEIESELKDIRESKQQMKENDQEELVDQQELKSERLELAKSIVDKTISKSIELLTVDKPEELEAITETSSETENEKIKEVQVAQEETKSIVAPKIDVISTQDDDEVEEKAKELVDKVLSISIEKLTDESTTSSQKPSPAQQQSPSSGSIIKTSTISPTSGGNYGSYSPKEVRFSNLVSTDSVISDHDVKDDFFENFDEKFSKHFDLIAGDGSLLIDVEQKARNDLIQTDQFSNLQSLILANNCENTFIKMNQKQKSEEEAAAHAAIEPVAEVSETRIQEESSSSTSTKLVEEAKSFVDNVIERALEKVSIVISDDEDGDDEKKKKRAKKQYDDDHQEAKFKGGKDDDDDDDDNNDDKRGPDFGPSGEAIEKREESQTVSSQDSTQYQSSEQKVQEQEHHDTEVVIESDEVQNQYQPNQPTEENLEQFDQVIEPPVQITYDLTTEDNQTDSETESEMIDYNTTLERTEIEKSNIEENKVVDELIDNNPPKPLLTSSFIDDKLPSETSKLSPDEDDDDEDRLSSKTLDLAANQQLDLDRTLSENNTTDELFKIKSSSSTSSYFTAVSSIPKQQPQQQEGEEDKDKSAHEFSIRTSGSSNYMTAAEEIRSDQNMSTSESFYSAYSSVPKHKSSSSSQHSESNQQQHQATGNSSFASLNSSYSTLNDNQLSGNLSGNLTDFDSSDEIEFQQNASQSSQEDPTATSLGQFNVEMFLKNMQPLVNRSNSQEDENRENSSSKSSHSTLTDDKKQVVEETVAIKTPSPSQEDFATLIASRGAEITEQKKESLTNVSPDLEMKISPTNQDPTILQHVQQQLHSSSSSSLSSSTSSLLAKNQLAKTQTEGNSQSFDLEHSLLYKNGNGDNISCTSSVLEFEKLEAQCNLEEDLGITSSELDIKPGVVRIKRPRDNMGMAELTEEVDLYGSSTSSTTSGVATLVDDDQAEGNMSDSEDDYSRNLIISHDLNTIYESQERETGSSNDEDSMSNNAASALVKEPSPRESLEDLEKRRDSGASKASDKSDPGSPSSTSKPNPTLEPPNKSQLSSRSNSSSSVRSTDSFENELKQKFKINEESFFARRKREKEKKPSPKSLEVAPQTSAAASSSQSSTQQQQELKSPPENRLDSGQSSMTTSFMSSASQLQSPANESSSSSHLSDRRLLSNDSFLTTSYMSDLNQQQQNEPTTSSSSSSQAETLQPGGSSRGGVKKSGRLSRASSSASSSSSTSLNDSSTRYSINSSIITVLSNQLNTVQPLTGEDLPSFKKKSPSPSPLSYKYESASCKMSPTQTTEKVVTSASASNISSQQMASTSADGSTTPTKQPSPKLKKQVVPPPSDNSKSLSKSHSHHSSDCYCGKHAESDKSKTKTSKSFTSETAHSASKKN